jgi:hypothetical protein
MEGKDTFERQYLGNGGPIVMDGMSGMTVGMVLIGILVVLVLILAAAALIKHLVRG